jgi:hypothetical protein
MVSIPGHIIRETLTLGLLKGVDDLCNDMESSIDEEYKYIIQILPSVLRNLAEANQDNTLRNFIKSRENHRPVASH